MKAARLFFAAFGCNKRLTNVQFCSGDPTFEREIEILANMHRIETAANWKSKVWKCLVEAWKLRSKPRHKMEGSTLY